MDLAPRHRQPFQLPGPWPACAQDLLRRGSPWLQGGDTGEGLLALPGPALTSTWDGQAWITRARWADACASPPGKPWSPLWVDTLAPGSVPPPSNWPVMKAACPGSPCHRAPSASIGRAVTEALHVQDGEAELWSWTKDLPDPAAWSGPGSPLRPGSALAGAGASLERSISTGLPWKRSSDASWRGISTWPTSACPLRVASPAIPITVCLSAFRRARPPFGALLDLGEIAAPEPQHGASPGPPGGPPLVRTHQGQRPV